MRTPKSLRTGQWDTATMCWLPVSSLFDRGDNPSPDEDSTDALVLGCLFNDDGQEWDIRPAVAAQLGLSSYETVWMMLHKLRRAMVNASREPLHGEVEVDETWVGGQQAGLRGSR